MGDTCTTLLEEEEEEEEEVHRGDAMETTQRALDVWPDSCRGLLGAVLSSSSDSNSVSGIRNRMHSFSVLANAARPRRVYERPVYRL